MKTQPRKSSAQEPLVESTHNPTDIDVESYQAPATPGVAPDDEWHADDGSDQQIRLQQRLAQLQAEPVKMIMKTPHGNSALWGNRQVQEGELLEDGIRITAIDRDGIRFEIVESSTTTPSTPDDER